MSILIFLAVLFVLILVHELGHFIVAKRTGMRVDEFGIGFPPRLFGVRKGETLYSINLFPIGGFVKIMGENMEDVEDEGDRARAFGARPKLAQTAVLIAGVTMNVLLAWVLFVAVLMMGVQTPIEEQFATEEASLIATDILAGSPAESAGIPIGAEIVSLQSGEKVLTTLTSSAFKEFVAVHGGGSFEVGYQVGSSVETVTLTPATNLVDGEPERAVVGLGLALFEEVAQPFPQAVLNGAIMTVTMLRDITIGISMLLWDAVQFKADFSEIAGPVGIVGLVGEASAFGLTALLMFTAFISLNLAIINLLPFPALDGGRLLFVAIEAIKGSPINPSWVGAFNTLGFALLILLMVAVTYNDILRIL